MKKLPVQVETIDIETGERTADHTVMFDIMPVREGACPECGRYPAHGADQPHDAQSLYYQYAFYGLNHRWPTWADAVAHCSADVRAAWEKELRARGVWTAPPSP